MAVILATVVTDDDGVVKITWPNLRNGDTGTPVFAARFADKTVGVIVNAAGSGDKITMEGSQDGGTTWGELHDPAGDLLSAELTSTTIEDLEVIAESPEAIRPNCTGDSVTDLTVIITAPSRGK